MSKPITYKTLTHKGFTGSVETDEDGMLFGTVQNISGLVLYEGADEAALEEDFRMMLDLHLALCEKHGWDPVHAPKKAGSKLN